MILRNIDIFDLGEDDQNCLGVMSINPSDRNLVRNVLFKHNHADDYPEGQFVSLRVVENLNDSAAPGHGLENIVFRDVNDISRIDHHSVMPGHEAAPRVPDPGANASAGKQFNRIPFHL